MSKKENKATIERTQAREDQRLARAQRQDLKDELIENFVQRPRLPKNRQRIITFSILGIIIVLATLFGILVLLPAPTQQPHGGIAVGTQAPDFTLAVYGGPGAGGVPIKLHALRGHPVVLNFWSESCQPCLSEVPYLRDLYGKYGSNGVFTLLGVNQDDPREDIESFGRTYRVNYPLLYDAGSSVNITYGITSLPMTYFIDSDGIVRYIVPQQLTPEAMQQGMEAVGIIIA